MDGYYDEDGNWVDLYDYSTAWGYDGTDDFATGSIYNDDGTLNSEASAIFGDADSSLWNTLAGAISKLGAGAFNALKSAYTKNGKTNWSAIAATAGGLLGLYGASRSKPQPTGYQGGIPKYEAVREKVPQTYDPNRRPGSSGQQYFTDTKYVKEDEDVAAARTAAKEEAAGLAALNASNRAKQSQPSPTKEAVEKGEESAVVQEGRAASDVIKDLPVPKYAHGGIAALARGGDPRYLAGQTDGMADKIPANIDGKQQAALSHGEFVIPADVVSHIGNGNSDAGAKRLYDMMAKIRKARTGNTQQGKQINPNKFLPA